MDRRLISRVQNLRLKNKIFFSTTLVILLISVVIALFTRWILISGLTSELKQRGIGIATSVAEASRSYMLTNDIPNLTSLIFDARLGERKFLISYFYILDQQERILAHTFTRPFPETLHLANRLSAKQASSVKLLHMNGTAIYDIAVPISEGIYQIGSLHAGLYKKHIDQLIGKLRSTFLGFVSVVTLLFFIISHRLSSYITRPISELTRISDEYSRGNFNIEPQLGEVIDAGSGRGQNRVQDEVHQLADSFLNMTHRVKESQIRLRESESKYRSLFTSGPNPIFVIDRNTLEILDANPNASQIYGYRLEELCGRPFSQLGPFEVPKSILHELEISGSARSKLISARVRHLKKDQSACYVNVHACPVRYQNRDALIVATTDITEIVEKESQLIQFSKLKTLGEMSAGIAHELNQPLNAIKMGSEYLDMIIDQGEITIPAGMDTAAREISQQVDRAVKIIDRLRDFGRKSDFTRVQVDINRPIETVLEIIGRQLRLQNIQVELDLDHALPVILAHHNRLEQVIFNLLANARDALNQKSDSGMNGGERRIRIQTFREGDRAVVTIADNGSGIPEGVRERIFDAFFTTKQMGEGMGLGLSISSGIVEDYGGKIEVTSREGQGTCFKLSFPVAN